LIVFSTPWPESMSLAIGQRNRTSSTGLCGLELIINNKIGKLVSAKLLLEDANFFKNCKLLQSKLDDCFFWSNFYVCNFQSSGHNRRCGSQIHDQSEFHMMNTYGTKSHRSYPFLRAIWNSVCSTWADSGQNAGNGFTASVSKFINNLGLTISIH
jgi:hypothetical protein